MATWQEQQTALRALGARLAAAKPISTPVPNSSKGPIGTSTNAPNATSVVTGKPVYVNKQNQQFATPASSWPSTVPGSTKSTFIAPRPNPSYSGSISSGGRVLGASTTSLGPAPTVSSVSSSSLRSSVPSISLPTPSYTDYSGVSAGIRAGQNSRYSLRDANGNLVQYDPATGLPVKDPNQSDQYDAQGLADLTKSLHEDNPAPNYTDIYNKVQKDSGVEQKQQEVNNYQAQLNSITATAEAQKISLVGQGRGIPEVIIGGQQAQIDREAAIKSLPVAALLSAAQNNLSLAQSHADTMFKLLSEDAQNQWKYQNDLIDSIVGFASKAEEHRLSQLKDQNDNSFTTQRDNLKVANDWAQEAIKNGQAQIGASIMGLMADPTSPNFQQDLAYYVGKIQGKTSNQIIGSAETGYTNVITDAQGHVISTSPVAGGSGGGGSKKLSILDVGRYNDLYPDAGVTVGDTEAQANAKVNKLNSAPTDTKTLIEGAKSNGRSYQQVVDEINKDTTIADKQAAIATAKEVYGQSGVGDGWISSIWTSLFGK